MPRKQKSTEGVYWLLWFEKKLNKFFKTCPAPEALYRGWTDQATLGVFELGPRGSDPRDYSFVNMGFIACFITLPMALDPGGTVLNAKHLKRFLGCYSRAPDFTLALTTEIRRIAINGSMKDRAASVILVKELFGSKPDKEIAEQLDQEFKINVTAETVKKIRQEAARLRRRLG